MQEPDVPPRQPKAIASDIEHDLANSLASIVGFSQVIRRDPSLPEDLRHSADLLVQEASRARAMVGELLDLVRRSAAEPRAATAQSSVVSPLLVNIPEMMRSAVRPAVANDASAPEPRREKEQAA